MNGVEPMLCQSWLEMAQKADTESFQEVNVVGELEGHLFVDAV